MGPKVTTTVTSTTTPEVTTTLTTTTTPEVTTTVTSTTTPEVTTTVTTTTPEVTTTVITTTTPEVSTTTIGPTTPENDFTSEEPTTTNWSGACSKTIIASDGMSETWESPNYDGDTANYPEGNYCCWLNVTIPSKYDMFIVNMEMTNPSRIYETSQCIGDHIDYWDSAGQFVTLCGDLSSQTWSELAVFDAPINFGFHWCSDRSDGGTDIGFQMTITGFDLIT